MSVVLGLLVVLNGMDNNVMRRNEINETKWKKNMSMDGKGEEDQRNDGKIV